MQISQQNGQHQQHTGFTGPTLNHCTSCILRRADAVLGGVGCQVNHLVKAKFATVD